MGRVPPLPPKLLDVSEREPERFRSYIYDGARYDEAQRERESEVAVAFVAVVAFMLGVAATLLVLWVMASGVGTSRAEAATLAFGSPKQRAGSPGWWVPVYVREFTGTTLNGVSLEVLETGTADVVEVEGATYWPETVAMLYAAGPDTVVLDAVKSANACEPDLAQGVLLHVRVVGKGTVTLAPGPMLRDCTNAPLEGVTLQEHVLVPPELPIPARRSTWGRVKGAFR